MKFHRLSKYFWELRFKEKRIVGTWEFIEKELKKWS